MKTFEAEKNSIPEGATHYSEEDKRNLFTWFKVGDKVEFYNNSTNKWQLVGAHISCLKSKITPIPKPETVEWLSDDECLVENTQGYVVNGEYEKYVGSIGVVRALFKTQGGVKMTAVQHCSGGCVCWREEMLSKPESPEVKDKREAVQKAMDFLAEDDHGGEAYHYKGWFEALYDEGMLTNYRKGE